MDKVKFLEKQYSRHVGRIIGLCYRYVNDREVAQDLTQDVFLKALEQLKAPRVILNFDHWLTRIAVNHCIDYLRKQPNFVPLSIDSVSESASLEESGDDVHIASKVNFSEKEILETIQQLPELQRAVFNLYAIERYSHRRIAGMLGISVDNSKQLHHRARVRLAKMLTDKKKEKDDKKKVLFMALFFFSLIRTYAKGNRIDRLYRSRLSRLQIDPIVVGAKNVSPQQKNKENTHSAANSSGKIATTLAAHKTAILLIAVTGLMGSAVAWYVVREEPIGTETEDVTLVETVCTPSPQDEIAPLQDKIATKPVFWANHYSPLREKTATHPIVETTGTPSIQTESASVPDESPVSKTIVIRDTVTVHDTILKMLDYD